MTNKIADLLYASKLWDPHTAAKQCLHGDKGLRGGLNLERPKGSRDTIVPADGAQMIITLHSWGVAIAGAL